MNEKERIIEYWKMKARESLEDAKLLLDNKRLHSAVNRIYYALFYQVSALLFAKGLSFTNECSSTEELQIMANLLNLKKEMLKDG